MWALLSEWCADAFAATSRKRRSASLRLYISLLAALFAALVGVRQAGPRGLLPVAVVVLLASFVARDVFAARTEAWRAARLPLGDPEQRPPRRLADGFAAPSAASLHALAGAVDSARRGRYAEANDIALRVQRDLLREDEARLLDAVRAMVSLGLGDRRRAAQQAAVALPTGSDEVDLALGRVMLTEAWTSPERLSAISDAWTSHGERDETAPLARLQRLVRLRLDPQAIGDVGPGEARALYDEARAIGADDLAAELDERGRVSAYR